MAKQATPIHSEDDYKEVKKDLTQKKKPSKILRLLMNSMEGYRQKKKYGWSRSWNKYNLVNFQVFKLGWEQDAYLLNHAASILEEKYQDMPPSAKEYCKDLLSDSSNIMGFIFVHDFYDNGTKYEGVTLSLGRISNKKYRDRLDVILESPIENGNSQGFQRTRLYIDPYNADHKETLYEHVSYEPTETSKKLFSKLSDISCENDESKLWNHWTVDYIDYFGERTWEMNTSFFYTQNNKTERAVLPSKVAT